jgi:beta-glucuronidase
MDIISVNRYAGWYGDEGHAELIERQTLTELKDWNIKFGKPVIMTEYGAGALAGFHSVSLFVTNFLHKSMKFFQSDG